MNLLACKGSWLLEWPKAYIRLGDSNNPWTTPPMLRRTPTLPSPLGQNNPVGPSSAPPTLHDQELLYDTSQYLLGNEDHEHGNQQFYELLGPLDLLAGLPRAHDPDQAPQPAEEAPQPEVAPQPEEPHQREVPAIERFIPCQKSLFEDNTPPDQNTQQDSQRKPMYTPNKFRNLATEVMQQVPDLVDKSLQKKGRKR